MVTKSQDVKSFSVGNPVSSKKKQCNSSKKQTNKTDEIKKKRGLPSTDKVKEVLTLTEDQRR